MIDLTDETYIRSLEKFGYAGYYVTNDGKVYSTRRGGCWIAQVTHRCGYLFTRVRTRTGKYKNRYIHQLVALAFVPNTNPVLYNQVNHEDGNKKNNHWTNLTWSNNLLNAHHARENKLMPHAKIDEAQAHEICRRIELQHPIKDIAEDMGVPYSTVHAISLRRNWIHVSSQYDFEPYMIRKKSPAYVSEEDIDKNIDRYLRICVKPERISEILKQPLKRVLRRLHHLFPNTNQQIHA